MNDRTRLRRRSIVAYVLMAFLLAGILPAAAYAQSTASTGSGAAHGMAGHHMMRGGRMMGGPMMGNRMMVGRGSGGMHGMMGRRAAASALDSTDVAAQAQAGAPGRLAAAPAVADPERGRQLVLASGCVGCHSLDPQQSMAGPTWRDLAETAASRVPGQSAAEYLYTSIVQPNAFLVPGYRPNIMVQSYARQLSEERIADIVSYLLTLQDGD